MPKSLKAFVRDQPTLRAGLLRASAMVRSLSHAETGIYTLCYHHVAASSRDSFSAQLQFFKRFGEFVDVETAVSRVASGEASQRRSFLLTFDDGYADNVDVALPVLEEHGIPALLFLVSDWLDEPPTSQGRTTGYMTRRDVELWLGAGLDIGSHSASHQRFSQLDDASAMAELSRSSQTLGEIAGKPVQHFACPWGVADADYLTARDPGLARQNGYRTFFTTRRGTARDGDDLMSMPRHVMEPEWATYQIDALLGGRRYAWA